MGSDNNTVKVRVKTITATCRVKAGLVNIVSVHLDLILQNKIPSKTSVVLCKYPFQNSLLKCKNGSRLPQKVNRIIYVCQGPIRISVAAPKQTHPRSAALKDTNHTLTSSRQVLAGGM